MAISQEFGSVSASNGRHKANGTLYGVNDGQANIDRLNMLNGRFINKQDNAEQRAVAVVSDVFVRQYFGQKATAQQVLGESFETESNGIPIRLYIVGVYEYKSPSGSKTISPKTGTNIYMPIASANKLMQWSSGYQSVVLQPKEGVKNSEFIDRTKRFFDGFYTRNPKFEVDASSMENMPKSMNKMTQTVQLGISGIAGISLLVGGIGHRANTRNRYSHGIGLKKQSDFVSVHRGSDHYLYDRRYSGNHTWRFAGQRCGSYDALSGTTVHSGILYSSAVFYGNRCVFWLLSCKTGSKT